MLVVEDGSGKSDAEAYVSVADATVYHARFGNPAWAAAGEGAQETALRRAAQYLDTQYTYRGEPLTDTQALAWPRDSFAWPVRGIVNASCELALRALSGPLFTDQSGPAIRSEAVGPVSVTYADDQRGGQTFFAGVDALVQPLTAGSSRMSMRIERAS